MISAPLQRMFASCCSFSPGCLSSSQGAARPGALTPSSRMYLLVVLAAFFVTFLDTSEVALALVGAFGYLVIRQASGKPLPKQASLALDKMPSDAPVEKTEVKVSIEPRQAYVRRERQSPATADTTPTPDIRQPSVLPVVCPSFAMSDWDGQISELLLKLAPADETAGLVHAIVDGVQRALRSSFPDASVKGFAYGNPKSSKAFAVAVPDVEIVANITPAEMIHFLGSHFSSLDAKCVQKAAIRACTDKLSYNNEFKFRRSAFKYDEPKVTLLASAALDSVPFHFSVNAKTPIHHDALLKAAAKTDIRVWELVLLVHRWARDRGISHAAKGHLSPYAWTFVVIFFSQVRTAADGAMLPAFRRLFPHFLREGKHSKKHKTAADSEKASVATLFKEFVDFYASDFDWHHEVLSIGNACRKVPAKDALEWRRQGGLEICDPFEPSKNLADLLSRDGLIRLKEEFGRATTICSRNGLLSDLLEPWVPPDSADGPTVKPLAETSKVKELIAAKPSLRGSLTASPMGFSLRPGGKSATGSSTGKTSLTASPMGLSLRPGGQSTAAGGSVPALTSSPIFLSKGPGSATSRASSTESGSTRSGETSIPTSSSDTD